MVAARLFRLSRDESARFAYAGIPLLLAAVHSFALEYEVIMNLGTVPLPDPAHPDRQVRVAIAVSAECTVIVEKDYSFVYAYLKLRGEPPKRVEEVEKLTWLGGVEATAEVVDRKFTKLTPVSLLSVDERGSDKWWK